MATETGPFIFLLPLAYTHLLKWRTMFLEPLAYTCFLKPALAHSYPALAFLLAQLVGQMMQSSKPVRVGTSLASYPLNLI
jgi:hypothetical protein